MYVKHFFERFWDSKREEKLFVCMPFDNSLDAKFNDVIIPAAKLVGLEATRVKEDKIADVITTKIFNGIANAKLLLFDLSDDPKCPGEQSKQVNGNVLYELGIANSFREPQDIILIREKSHNRLPFDVSGMRYVEYDSLTVDELAKLMKDVLTQQEWYKSKQVKAVAEAIDEISVLLMFDLGRRPDGHNHFSTLDFDEKIRASFKASVARLVDLGILKFCTEAPKNPEYCAYHWTQFGLEVMKHLGIERFKDMEEFKKENPEGYYKHIQYQEQWAKFVEKEKLKKNQS